MNNFLGELEVNNSYILTISMLLKFSSEIWAAIILYWTNMHTHVFTNAHTHIHTHTHTHTH